MPIGYLTAVAVVAAGTVLAVRPFRGPTPLAHLSWLLSAVVNESPFVAAYWLLAVTGLALAQGDLDGLGAGAAVGVGVLTLLATPVLVKRALAAGAVLDEALDEGLGSRWRDRATGSATSRDPRRLPWFRILAAPLPVSRRGVRRVANLRYGPHGRRNRLDVYRGDRQLPGAPILIHLHGGGFRSGRKSFYARAMLHELASQGWVVVSASYRLRPAGFTDFVIDVKRVIAWAREHAPEHGADPSCIVLAGSSAGAHLAMTAALTPGDPAYQPGFEDVDTSVSAAIGLYGYYGPIESGPGPSQPADFAHPAAPPIFVVSGGQDTLVPPQNPRQFVSRVRAVSTNPVVYAELPGAQHSFDLFHSARFARVVVGIAEFLGWLRSPGGPTKARTTSQTRKRELMPNKLFYRGPELHDLHESYAKRGRIDTAAPVQASHEVLIDADPAAVWALLSDPVTWPRVDPDVRGVRISSTPAVDTEFRWQRGPARMRSRFAVLTPDREVTWTGTSVGARAVHRHVLEPYDGGTRLFSEESIAGILLARYFPSDKLEAGLAAWLGHVRAAAGDPGR